MKLLKTNIKQTNAEISSTSNTLNEKEIESFSESNIQDLPIIVVLRVTAGNNVGHFYQISEKAIIGRDKCDVIIPDPLVSLRHAQVITTSSQALITDFNSSNGTVLNNHKIPNKKAIPLSNGDILKCGNTILNVSIIKRTSKLLPKDEIKEEPITTHQPKKESTKQNKPRMIFHLRFTATLFDLILSTFLSILIFNNITELSFYISPIIFFILLNTLGNLLLHSSLGQFIFGIKPYSDSKKHISLIQSLLLPLLSIFTLFIFQNKLLNTSIVKREKPFFTTISILIFLLLISLLYFEMPFIYSNKLLSKINISSDLLISKKTASETIETIPMYNYSISLPTNDRNIELITNLQYQKSAPEKYLPKINLLFRNKSDPFFNVITFTGKKTKTFKLYDIATLFTKKNLSFLDFLEKGLRTNSNNFPSDYLNPIKTYKTLFGLIIKNEFLKNEKLDDVLLFKNGEDSQIIFKSKVNNAVRYENNLFLGQSRLSIFFDFDKEYKNTDEFYKNTISTISLNKNIIKSRENINTIISSINIEKYDINTTPSLSTVALYLASKLSVEPSSIETYYHFAGVNMLLYSRYVQLSSGNQTILQIFKTNIINAAKYAQDVNPEHALTKNLLVLRAKIEGRN